MLFPFAVSHRPFSAGGVSALQRLRPHWTPQAFRLYFSARHRCSPRSRHCRSDFHRYVFTAEDCSFVISFRTRCALRTEPAWRSWGQIRSRTVGQYRLSGYDLHKREYLSRLQTYKQGLERVMGRHRRLWIGFIAALTGAVALGIASLLLNFIPAIWLVLPIVMVLYFPSTRGK